MAGWSWDASRGRPWPTSCNVSSTLFTFSRHCSNHSLYARTVHWKFIRGETVAFQKELGRKSGRMPCHQGHSRQRRGGQEMGGSAQLSQGFVLGDSKGQVKSAAEYLRGALHVVFA